MVATRRSKRTAARGEDKEPPSASKPTPSRSKKARTGLSIGDDCPSFTLENEEGQSVTLEDLIKDNPIIIFMYPKANTPGCTKQACGFRDNFSDITAAGYQVYGLSADKPQAQNSWKTKQQYQYHFLCDVDYEFMKKLGVVKDGKKITRSHIIVGTDGKLLDLQIGVTPQESVDKGIEYAKEHPHKASDEAADKIEEDGGQQGKGDEANREEPQDEEGKDGAKDDTAEKANTEAKPDGDADEGPKENAEAVEGMDVDAVDATGGEDKDAAADVQQDQENQTVTQQAADKAEGEAEATKDVEKKPEDWVVVDKDQGTAPNAAPEQEPPAAEAPPPQAEQEEQAAKENQTDVANKDVATVDKQEDKNEAAVAAADVAPGEATPADAAPADAAPGDAAPGDVAPADKQGEQEAKGEDAALQDDAQGPLAAQENGAPTEQQGQQAEPATEGKETAAELEPEATTVKDGTEKVAIEQPVEAAQAAT